MIVDAQKRECINLLIEGKKITDIAKEIGASRTSIYNWMDNEEFKAELNKSLQRIKSEGEQRILSDLSTYIDNIKYLATKARSEKTRLDANTYLTDRVLGKTTSKLEIKEDNKQKEENVNILDEIDEFEDDTEENE